jgi:hypothetical protein
LYRRQDSSKDHGRPGLHPKGSVLLFKVGLDGALNRQLGVLPNLYPIGKPTIYGGDMKKMFIIGCEVKAMSFLTGFTKWFFSMFYG